MKNRKEILTLALYSTGMALAYCISGILSLSVFHENALITMSAFFPEGFALAGVLLFGKRVLPGIFLGQLALAHFSGFPMPAGIMIGFSNTMEALLALYLFDRLKLDTRLHSLRDVFGLLLMIALILQPFSAFMGNAALYLNGILTASQLPNSLFYWWIGNLIGQLLLTPMLLILYHERKELRPYLLIVVITATLLLNTFFQITLDIKNSSLLLIVTLPATIYLATLNLSYASVASVVLASVSLYFAHEGIGTFTDTPSMIDNLLDLNYFMASHIILVLLVGVLFKEKEEAIRALRSMAHFDYLTGLPNRHRLREEIHHAVVMAQEHGYQSAVCFIDLDNFKPINDKYGHHVGDETLKEVTERLKYAISAQDALLRIGGDEFLIILNHIEDREHVDTKLQTLISYMDEPITVGTHRFYLSFSIGVSFCPEHGIRVKDLMEKADQAMYQAKAKGKNQICYA
jgi:diguanylate cyclase (GGDEF)-like protein